MGVRVSRVQMMSLDHSSTIRNVRFILLLRLLFLLPLLFLLLLRLLFLLPPPPPLPPSSSSSSLAFRSPEPRAPIKGAVEGAFIQGQLLMPTCPALREREYVTTSNGQSHRARAHGCCFLFYLCFVQSSGSQQLFSATTLAKRGGSLLRSGV